MLFEVLQRGGYPNLMARDEGHVLSDIDDDTSNKGIDLLSFLILGDDMHEDVFLFFSRSWSQGYLDIQGHSLMLSLHIFYWKSSLCSLWGRQATFSSLYVEAHFVEILPYS